MLLAQAFNSETCISKYSSGGLSMNEINAKALVPFNIAITDFSL
jgi:hypothetical protein